MWKIQNPASNLFFLKKISTHHAAEKALCTKRHFSNRNHSLNKNAKIPKISKILLSYFFKKKSKKKSFFFSRRLPRLGIIFFFWRLRRLFFFFSIGKWKSLGKLKKTIEKNSGRPFEGEGLPENSFFLEKWRYPYTVKFWNVKIFTSWEVKKVFKKIEKNI